MRLKRNTLLHFTADKLVIILFPHKQHRVSYHNLERAEPTLILLRVQPPISSVFSTGLFSALCPENSTVVVLYSDYI